MINDTTRVLSRDHGLNQTAAALAAWLNLTLQGGGSKSFRDFCFGKKFQLEFVLSKWFDYNTRPVLNNEKYRSMLSSPSSTAAGAAAAPPPAPIQLNEPASKLTQPANRLLCWVLVLTCHTVGKVNGGFYSTTAMYFTCPTHIVWMDETHCK